jgi:hypothetical protein
MTEDSVSRRNTDPIWIQDHFLGTGHTEETHNATATFVHRRGKNYVVTCKHVLDASANPEIVPGAMYPTLALHLDKSILNLSAITSEGIKVSAAVPHASRKEEEIDIAICELSESYWNLLQQRKSKIAIDLDNWKPPSWDKVGFGLAVGYPDEHKDVLIIENEEKVSSKKTEVVAEFTNPPNGTQNTYTICSQLNQPHGFYFSGMSGGPLYAVEGDFGQFIDESQIYPIGIVFEGSPSSRNAPQGFFGGSDIYIQAIALTPERFDEWLERAFSKLSG